MESLGSGLTLDEIVENKSVSDLWVKLQRACAACYDNDIRGVTKVTGHTKIPLRYLIQVWTGKSGRVRGHLTAKRSNYTARSVISPAGFDQDIDQLGVPNLMAKKITYPEDVTKYNIHRLRKTVLRGPDMDGGALNIIKQNGEVIDLRYSRNRRSNNVQIGMKVERHLMDDDIVLFGRQPSLHKMSLMALRVKIHNGSTFKVCLPITTPYNADFDGDEMNMYVPQTEEARAEAYHLMKPDAQINDLQDKACVGLKQDSLLGSYLSTSRDIFHVRQDVIRFAGQMLYWKGHEKENGDLPVPAVVVIKKNAALASTDSSSSSKSYQSYWTGKQCAAMTFPSGGADAPPNPPKD
jgi:DNA-directed RNA polymerase II subunit RPB1